MLNHLKGLTPLFLKGLCSHFPKFRGCLETVLGGKGKSISTVAYVVILCNR